ncbi:hypothetical protein EV714DRAFT_237263 [Schizophyllum commune]
MAGFRFIVRQVLRYMDGLIQVAIFVLTLVAVVGAYDSNPAYVTACGALAALGALWAFWRQVSARRAIMAMHDKRMLDGDLPMYNSPTSTSAPYAPTLSTPRPRTESIFGVSRKLSTSPPAPPTSKGHDRQRLNYIQQLTGTPYKFEDTSHGPPHQPIWTSRLYFGGKLAGEGQHSNKKAAQEAAAATALRKFEEEEKSRVSRVDNEKDGGSGTEFEGYLVDVGNAEHAQN